VADGAGSDDGSSDAGRYAALHVFAAFGPTEEFDEDQLFHIKGWSTNGMVGLSPIAYARHSLGTAIAAEEAAGKFFANGLSASGFIQTGGAVLSKENRDRFKASLREFQGSSNAGKVMLLEGGFTYNQLSMTPDDAQLLATRTHSVEDICRWFDVDPSLIGQSSSGLPRRRSSSRCCGFTR
jgi:HK97 family phage portal protein